MIAPVPGRLPRSRAARARLRAGYDAIIRAATHILRARRHTADTLRGVSRVRALAQQFRDQTDDRR